LYAERGGNLTAQSSFNMALTATPLPAATVVLVQPDGRGRFELYLNRRPDRMDTYAGAYVFPGGRVEEDDSSAAMLALTRGVTAIEAQHKLGVDWQPETCLAYWIAAARELFEEAGIHFFCPDGGIAAGSLPEDTSRRLATKRPALQRRDIRLPELLCSEKLCCDLARLNYFFHRVTPEHYAVRFDTRFFLAVLPDSQVPLHASEEVSESLWLAPATALERAEAGKYRMMPPTLAVLRKLNAYRSWENLRDAFALP
jgi:8-oxo-dGTP pyrophosphatase MutT (NUDIX family)